MAKPLRVLIVEDNEDDALLLAKALKDGGYNPIFERVDTPQSLKSALSGKEWDCIISDYSLPQFSGLAALQEVQERRLNIPFILVSGTIGEETAVEAMKAGAHDYIMKGKLMRLIPALERSLADAEGRRKQKQAEAAVRESEDRYRDLVQQSSDLICTHDLDGNILSMNPAATRLTGYSEGELLHMNLKDLLVPEIRHQFDNYLVEIQAKESLKGSMFVETKSGERRIWEYDNSLRKQVNAVSIVRGRARDVTEQREAEETLRQSEERFRQIAENISEVFWMSDPGNTKILYVSPAYEQIWGRTCQSLYDRPISFAEAIHPDDREQAMKQFESQARGVGHDNEYRILRPDGSSRWIWDRAFPVRNQAGEVVRIAGISQDITERKESEQAKAELERQLFQSQKMEAIGQLAGSVAHDFNNILMAIMGYCELMLMKTASADPLQASLLEVQKAAKQGATLTRQLLAFSRRQMLEPKVFNLNDVIKNMEGMLRRLIKEDIVLKLSLYRDLGRVKADSGQIEQVFMNLVVNASDAMSEGGTLTIETSNVSINRGFEAYGVILQPRDYVTISVKDTGMGMDERTRAQIFEPFFTTKEQGKGTGLGLSTVYGIVKQSEGYIFVESAPGHGTTFTIYLPRCEGREEPSVISGSVTAMHRHKWSESILLVDDNDSLRSAVAGILEISGYRVLQACNGQEGLDVSRRHDKRIDLVITDVVMPLMGGPEFVRQLLANHPEIKVIYMSGYSEEAEALQRNLNPGCAYLQKPTSMQTLLDTIRELVDAETAK